MERIANLLTEFLIKENNDKKMEFEVYRFAFLMSMEVLINIIIALILSSIFGMVGYGILFLILFSLLRAFAGGIHLKTFWSCSLLSSAVLCFVLATVKFVVIPTILSCGISIFISVLIYLVGPIDDINRRLLKKEHKIFYRKLGYLLLFLNFLSALFNFMNLYRITFMVCITLVVFHVVQIAGKNKNMKMNG